MLLSSLSMLVPYLAIVVMMIVNWIDLQEQVPEFQDVVRGFDYPGPMILAQSKPELEGMRDFDYRALPIVLKNFEGPLNFWIPRRRGFFLSAVSST